MSAGLLAMLDQLDEARAKATPGPWQYDPSEGDTVWDADEQRPSIIALTRDPYGNREADAALIVVAVNAAPKLTAALRAVLELAAEYALTELPPDYGSVIAAEIRATVTVALTPEQVQP